MQDVLYIAAGVLVLWLCWALARLCERL